MKKNRFRLVGVFILFHAGLLAITSSCMSDDLVSQEGEVATDSGTAAQAYALVDTNQGLCYDALGFAIECPAFGAALSGQDAQYDGNQLSYTDNGDGTITDNVTGLMWQQDPGEKKTYDEAVAGAASFELAGYDDWRLPTIKELYSLILFDGTDPHTMKGDTSGLTPFIDDDYFAFAYGDTSTGDRVIDSQWATNAVYGASVMGGEECFFGVNFADGRIKCYPTAGKSYFTIYVRDGGDYGTNDFQENGDGTVTDLATGLMWMQADSGAFGAGDEGDGALDWEQALSFCEELSYANQTDWRLPNAKELQSIVDYSRSPDATASPAIDPVFETTSIMNEAGEVDYPFFWTGTTHVAEGGTGEAADYVAFGRAMGFMFGQWVDVHGAGAQRSDPKSGDPADYPEGRGPQGDAIRIYNYVRCVRDAS